eukprot:13079209-Alexandrium_andersonii.AAC.1
MLASFAKRKSGKPQVNWSWGSGFGLPGTLRARLKTSRARRFSGKVSRTMSPMNCLLYTSPSPRD